MRRFVHRASVIAAVASLVLALAGSAPASASTFLAMELHELVQASEAVVEGKVLQLVSRWDDEGRVIVTDALVEVVESLTGDAPGAVWVRTFGGQVGNYTVEAIGFPRFAEGEQVLLFLNRPQETGDTVRVTGHQLGHYRIEERGGERIAVPTLEAGVRLLTKSGGHAAAPGAMALSELKSEISRLERRAPQPVN